MLAGRVAPEAADSRAPGDWRSAGYFRLALTLPNVLFRLEPSDCTATMMATEMPAAISPYSIAVAPLSSRRKDLRSFMTTLPRFVPTSALHGADPVVVSGAVEGM